ncbi:MAG: Crp/Fnr family transcriptional regulator [Patescibacteria group bacterium]
MSPDKKIADFFKKYPTKIYKQNQTILEAYQTPKYAIFIKNGSVDQFDITKNGNKVILNTYKSGAFFSMSWFLVDIQNKYFFVANQKSEIIEAPSQSVKLFLNTNPDVVSWQLNRLVRGADGLLKRLNVHMSGSADERILLELSILASRFSLPNKNGACQIHISVQQLAWQAGLSRESVSRTIKKLEHQKKLSHKKGFFVLPKIASEHL